jgi:eukaryotic-like serine/threonine-protein kinase
MPSPTTIDEFLELVLKSGVVEDKRLTTYVDKLRAAKRLPSEPAKLAGSLVQDGLLTRFQAEQFLQGKWRRFTIGKYKVLEKLGSGGMGNVFLCEHKLMRRRVAVKVLPAKGAEESSTLERFYREARAVAALDHPNIVRAYDIDQDDNLHFLVMEHVDGASLQEIVKKAGPMDVLRACHYIRQAALGLQHAHEAAGIVHRDIKPGNVLVDRNGIVKILDMGLARFFHDEEDILTKKFEENVLGTADYLAPEQALDSHSVDIRADIYSLGATFYFCMTARTPFAEGTVAQKLIWHQTRQPKPVRQLRPEVPEGVAAVLEKMMAKDPSQRYQTPNEVAEALAAWTQTPIPPPPANEMPQLSPAAMGNPGSETNLSSGPRTPASGSPLSPTPRKLWQVKQSGSAAPLPPSAPPASPPPPSSDLRKTNPPPQGPLNLQLTIPSAASSNQAVALATPQAGLPAVAVQNLPAEQPQALNGTAKALVAPAPMPPIIAEVWEDLRAKESSSKAVNLPPPRTSRRGLVSATPPVGGLPPQTASRPLGWIIGIASVSLAVLLILGTILAWIFNGKSDSAPSSAEAAVFHVNPRGGTNAATTLTEVINRLHGKNRPARIIVEDDIAENDLLIDVPNVTIEAAEGKTIHWRPASKPGATKLFAIYKAEGVHIKGFTLDGEDRVEMLVNLFHRCPGVRLEGLTLQGFKKYGIWVTNCEGGEGKKQRIQLNRLQFTTSKAEQAAVFFSIEAGTRDAIPKNRNIVFTACAFAGPGAKIKSQDLSTLEHIEWPEGVAPVQGR